MSTQFDNCHPDLPYEKAKSEFERLIQLAALARGQRVSPDAEAQVMMLHKFLTTQTEWLTTPGSSKYHMCIEGGLLIHSVKVCKKALELRDCWAPNLYLDSVILCALFHDLGKVWGKTVHTDEGDVIVPRYLKNDPNPDGSFVDSKQKGPYRVEESTGMEIAVRSLRMVEKFVELSDAEAQAIHGHDHYYIASNTCYQHRETPLMLITHYSDFWVGHVLEAGMDMNVDNDAHFMWST